jgi:hypothetical protein
MNGGLTDQVCNDFAVTSRPELVAVGKELLPDGPIVVDLAVHGDYDSLDLVAEGLVAGGWVDDGETLVGKVAVGS